MRKVSPVKTHTRGLQEFEIDGLQCSLAMPGRDRKMVTEARTTTVRIDGEQEISGEGDEAIEEMLRHELPKRYFKPHWYQTSFRCDH